MNPEVVFIYPNEAGAPCHAVRKDVDGPWSNQRVAFCGWQAPVGPVGFITTPQGGLCHRCQTHIVQVGKTWRSATKHADPVAAGLARILYESGLLGDPINKWGNLGALRQKQWIELARLAIDRHPVGRPHSYGDGGYDDD